jgi:shikimate dehydrogenase
MAEPSRHAFVCGHPVAHSRSPLIHRYWLNRHRIDGSYTRVDVRPEDFARFVSDLPASRFAGGNVTIPHKEAAARLVSKRDESAEIVGAVNTLWLEDGEVRGGNTDAYGFAAYLDRRAPGWTAAGVATVIGAGGAARAVVHALKTRGFREIRVVNRTLTRAVELADRFGGVTAHEWNAIGELLSDTGLLVNTTALGMAGKPPLSLDLSPLPDSAIVDDIVYVPLKTELLTAAEERGLKAVDGVGMLIHQAVYGFERWFGVRPEVTDDLHAMLVADLEPVS